MQFTLTGTTDVNSEVVFKNMLVSQNRIADKIYIPNYLRNTAPHPRLKIARKSFINVSFSKTVLKNIDFFSCHFENCLLIGTTIDNCDFQQCSFKNVNTHKIRITNTYLDPSSFISNYKGYSESNLAVHLFQQLLNNSQDTEQREFARTANYHFLKWKGKLSWYKYKFRQPDPINICEFIDEGVPNYLYRFTFGYGLRIRNFLFTFSLTFLFFYFFNFIYWKEYVMKPKDLTIETFSSGNVSYIANFFYTIDVTTKVIDSQFQPSSAFGMLMLTLEGLTGFLFFSFLITILINKFVR